jgi:N-acetylmuramoyl-L-alanine amidase
MDSRHRTLYLALLPLLLVASGCTRTRTTKVTRTTTEEYVAAQTMARQLGMKLVHESQNYVTMRDDRNTLTIFTGRAGRMYLNGNPFGQPDNAIWANGKVYVLEARHELLRWELRPRRPAPAPPKPAPRPVGPFRAKVVVDAGHGGKDPGAPGRIAGVNEKVIVLDVAKRLERTLIERGGAVTMTRTGDRFVELDDRAAIAERSHCDLFIAIHADSATRRAASGVTLYIARNASARSYEIARRVERALGRGGINCRGIRKAGYRVLVAHSRPALLVECGFLTNPTDARLLATARYRQKLADLLAAGIASAFPQ